MNAKSVEASYCHRLTCWRIDLAETVCGASKEEAERIANYKLNLYQNVEQLQAKNEQLKRELEDIRLELSTPSTVGLSKEPLYKWAALIVCEGHQLREENERLKEALRIATDYVKSGNYSPRTLEGKLHDINQALKGKQ